MNVNVTVAVVLYALCCFYQIRKKDFENGLSAVLVFGWLFLPNFTEKFAEGIPAVDKIVVSSVIPFLAIGFFCLGRLLSFRWSKFDIPMIIWCLVPVASSLSNGYGPYDAGSELFARLSHYGIPYLLGRQFIQTTEQRKFFLKCIVIGACIYVPLCLFEMRFSPQLHRWVYGHHPHSFAQSIRGEGWRPIVFLKHGLPTALYLVISAVVLSVLTKAKILFRQPKTTVGYAVMAAIIITIILTRSAYAIIILAVFQFWVWIPGLLMNPIVILLLTGFPIFYTFTRVSGLIRGPEIAHLVEPYIEPDRIQSFLFRMTMENDGILTNLDHPLLGWSSWGRTSPPSGEFGDFNFVYDSQWILALSTNGLIGLLASSLLFLLPGLYYSLYGKKIFRRETDRALFFAYMALLSIVAYDNLLNDFPTPIYIYACGILYGMLSDRNRVDTNHFEIE